MLQQWCIGASAVFLKLKEPQSLYGVFLGFLIAWGYVGAYHLGGGLRLFLPSFGLLAGACFWTAWGYVKLRRSRAYMGGSLLAFSFCVWGGYLIAFAILQYAPYHAGSLYFLSGVVQMLMAVSMIVLTLEESRETLDRMHEEVEDRRTEARGLTTALSEKSVALKRSEARFESLAMAAPVGIMETGRDGSPIFHNDRWLEMVGELESGGEWTDRVCSADRRKVSDAWACAQVAESDFALEFQLELGGGTRWLLGQATVLRDQRNRFQGCLVTLSDIDELKAEQERRMAMESRLRQTQKLETMGVMAGGVAHGFNNLLQPILGFTRLAMDSLEPEHEAREDLDYVSRAARRATALVRQMLAFSRQSENARRPLFVQSVVGEDLKLLRASLPSNVPVKILISPECPPVLADASQVHQIAMNLVTNAYHASKDAGGGVCVELKPETVSADEAEKDESRPPGEYVCLEVRDTGIGMDEEIQRRVFEPFFTTKEVGDGTGLGLSVVHGIVLAHDGFITVESELGKGSTFRASLPVTGAETEEIPEEQTVHGGDERILFVEDDEDVALLGKKMLERLGYRITVVTDSIEASELFADKPDDFDLVIADQLMPGLTGERLAREMLAQRADLPIIMITGFGDVMTSEESRKIGIREFVLKPVSARDLGRVVRRTFDDMRPAD